LSTGEQKPQTIYKRPSGLALIYKQHWHVEFTHFPVSFFLGSALFTVLHFISYSNRAAYELAAFVLLIAGMAVMWPTTLTGWNVWKNHYRGAYAKIFLYKIRTAFAMIGLSVFLVVWRAVIPPDLDTFWFYFYAAGIFLLLAGTVIEGYYGGRLNHR
jgi:hypothetical protein